MSDREIGLYSWRRRDRGWRGGASYGWGGGFVKLERLVLLVVSVNCLLGYKVYSVGSLHMRVCGGIAGRWVISARGEGREEPPL